MLKFIGALCLSLAAQGALAQDSAVADETPAAEQASEKVESRTTAAATKEEFKPPVGFQTRKRGELTLYCKKEAAVGTRFKSEKCYSEDQVRDYIIAQQENKRDIDRIINTCGGGSACATN
jgi:hypothetical protein